MKDTVNWQKIPQKGISPSEINTRIEKSLCECIDYEKGSVLGFPGTTPSCIAISAYGKVAVRQPNNLGYHTKDDPSEMGFLGTQKIERDFIYGVADMLGVQNPEEEIDGYICSGGTEGNDHGLWLARNKLWSEYEIKNGERPEIVVLHSFLFHYSLGKAFGRLLGGENRPDGSSGRGVIYELPTDDRGELAPEILERKIRECHSNGYRRFAIFLTAGTTNLGSVDPVYEAGEMLKRLKTELNMGVYVHVDAAFGGFIIPFVEPDCQFAFQHPFVSSVSLDAHKTGGMPYPAGVFLCRKGLLGYTATAASYIYGRHDHTVSGSRSGAVAAACWATLQHYGREGYATVARYCMEIRDYFIEQLGRIEGLHIYPSHVNIIAVRFSRPLSERILMDYCIVSDKFPDPLSSSVYNEAGQLIERSIGVNRFTLMPHVTREKIDQFFKEWNS
jgi:tyrosine decarboxylase/aspartate 1-decarboxylase